MDIDFLKKVVIFFIWFVLLVPPECLTQWRWWKRPKWPSQSPGYRPGQVSQHCDQTISMTINLSFKHTLLKLVETSHLCIGPCWITHLWQFSFKCKSEVDLSEISFWFLYQCGHFISDPGRIYHSQCDSGSFLSLIPSHGVLLSAPSFLCLHTSITASLCGQLVGVS